MTHPAFESQIFAPGNAVHFVGIGGAGMFPLASIAAQCGCRVSGSDLDDSLNVRTLQDTLDIPIAIGPHSAAKLPSEPRPILVVHTSATARDNPELLRAQELGIRTMRRGDALAAYAAQCKRVVTVSGSHGKTTITAMIAHLLRECEPNAGFIVGGKVNGWKIPSNAGDGDIFVTEADESDGSHTALHSWLGIVPNVEDDHAWSVGGAEKLFANFKTYAAQCQHLIAMESPTTRQLFDTHPDCIFLNPNEICKPGYFVSVPPHWPDHQLWNAALALAVAERLNIDRAAAETALASFPGASRRMTLHAEAPHAILYEDYAHHPTELRAFLNALAKLHPGWRRQVIFQPHRYARLNRYIDEFAELLRPLEQVIVTPVFAAWVEKGGVSADDLAERIGPNAVAVPENDWERIAGMIDPLQPHDRGTVTAVIGAGDIDRVIPFLKERMT